MRHIYWVYILKVKGHPQCLYYVGQTINAWRRVLEHVIMLSPGSGELVGLYAMRSRENAIALETYFHSQQVDKDFAWEPDECCASFVTPKSQHWVMQYCEDQEKYV